MFPCKCNHPCSPSDLEGEYHGMLGRPLPWRKLGFSSLLDLVKRMPDVVRAETLPYVSP